MPIAFSKQQALGLLHGRRARARTATRSTVRCASRSSSRRTSSSTLTLGGDRRRRRVRAVHANVDGAYLFGAPLQGGDGARVRHARRRDRSSRKVGTISRSARSGSSPSKRRRSTPTCCSATFRSTRKATRRSTFPCRADLPFPMTYTVDMETTDVSNLSVSDSQSFLALPTDAMIGLASDAVGTAGSADADSRDRDRRGRQRDRRARGASRAAEDDVRRRRRRKTRAARTRSSRSSTTPSRAPTSRSGAIAGNVSAHAAAMPGPYRVVANFGGAGRERARSATTSKSLRSARARPTGGSSDPNAVAVKLDKKQYAIGDTATALVASPFAQADVYFAVVRNDALYRTTLHDVSGSVRVHVQDHARRCCRTPRVQAVVVRRGATDSGNAEAADALARPEWRPSTSTSPIAISSSRSRRARDGAPGGAQRVDFTANDQERRAGARRDRRDGRQRCDPAALRLSSARSRADGLRAAADLDDLRRQSRERDAQDADARRSRRASATAAASWPARRARAFARTSCRWPYYGVLKTDASGHAQRNTSRCPTISTTWRVMAVALRATTPRTSRPATRRSSRRSR